ncbi:hypothetical protein [uncultured Secundilactobacillus sp.]|uniref:hypothetical protein n=1 Tax=uncultured Secundilactobacillus sp. TaxID=2813935 RepID=UPI0025830964|nr:hypothetical protein [uncultured Secundilactobacillus sp.]
MNMNMNDLDKQASAIEADLHGVFDEIDSAIAELKASNEQLLKQVQELQAQSSFDPDQADHKKRLQERLASVNEAIKNAETARQTIKTEKASAIKGAIEQDMHTMIIAFEQMADEQYNQPINQKADELVKLRRDRDETITGLYQHWQHQLTAAVEKFGYNVTDFNEPYFSFKSLDHATGTVINS